MLQTAIAFAVQPSYGAVIVVMNLMNAIRFLAMLFEHEHAMVPGAGAPVFLAFQYQMGHGISAREQCYVMAQANEFFCESLILPLAIILIVPMCLLSAITGVWLTGGDNNIFTQIGLFACWSASPARMRS